MVDSEWLTVDWKNHRSTVNRQPSTVNGQPSTVNYPQSQIFLWVGTLLLSAKSLKSSNKRNRL
jgi:hypothetical protein